MSDQLKRVPVRIAGTIYHLITGENEQYTRQIGARADEMIRRIMQDNPQLSQSMATILALVNAVDEGMHLARQIMNGDDRWQAMERKTDEMRRELMRLRDQNWELKKEVLRLGQLARAREATGNGDENLTPDSESEAFEPISEPGVSAPASEPIPPASMTAEGAASAILPRMEEQETATTTIVTAPATEFIPRTPMKRQSSPENLPGKATNQSTVGRRAEKRRISRNTPKQSAVIDLSAGADGQFRSLDPPVSQIDLFTQTNLEEYMAGRAEQQKQESPMQ